MMKLLDRIVKAPLKYIADLRAITFKYPSYPIMIASSLIFTLMLSFSIIYFVVNNPMKSQCFDNLKIGAYIISILYPIETILCFICLTGTIALSKNRCWKVFWIFLFGPIISGFGFGEVGLVQICLLSTNDELIKVPSIIKEPGFIDSMVYIYISFIVLYFILVPSINYLYTRQNADKKDKQQSKQVQQTQDKKEKQQQKSCCNSFICVLYFTLNTLFFIIVVFILFIKVLGPIIFTYIWIQMGSNIHNFSISMQKFVFAFSILAYFGPLGLMMITLGIQRMVKLGREKKDGEDNKVERKSQLSQTTERKTIDIESDPNSIFYESKQNKEKATQKSKIEDKPHSVVKEIDPKQKDQEKPNKSAILNPKSSRAKQALL